jgi:hypothetical protein
MTDMTENIVIMPVMVSQRYMYTISTAAIILILQLYVMYIEKRGSSFFSKNKTCQPQHYVTLPYFVFDRMLLSLYQEKIERKMDVC